MAKKKSSAKKPVAKKSPVKKSAKKPTAKKSVVKKSAPKKKVAAKVAPKKAAKAAPKKAIAKKVVKKATPVKKAAPKKTAPVKKAPAMKAVAPVAKPQKALDLSGFVTPLDDRLLVQVSETERMTPGGLYIPATVSDVSGNLHGTVVSVGRGHMDKKGHIHPLDVQLGDKIVFAEFSGSKIKIQNQDLLILRESEVMGVVSK